MHGERSGKLWTLITSMVLPFHLAGSGVYVPQRRVTAGDLDEQLRLTPGTTLARNGVATRYFADADETASAMATLAIERALEAAGLEAASLDAILFSGVMSEQPMPSTAILIHRKLGGRAHGVTCFRSEERRVGKECLE